MYLDTDVLRYMEEYDHITIEYNVEKIIYQLDLITDGDQGYITINFHGATYRYLAEKQLVDIIINDDLTAEFAPLIGYDFVNWEYNGLEFSIDERFDVKFDATFLRKYLYKNQTSYSVDAVQDLGVFEALSKLIKFRIKVEINDYFNDKLLDSYILGLDDSFITVTSNNEELNYMFINANFNISLNPTASNGYLCYQNNSTDYAILQMFIKGSSKNYTVEYDFPTFNFESLNFKLNMENLSDLVIVSNGSRILEKYREIKLIINTAKILTVSSTTNENLALDTDINDILKGERSLFVKGISVASAKDGEKLTRTDNYIQYFYQTQEAKISVSSFAKNYYKNAIVSYNQGGVIEYITLDSQGSFTIPVDYDTTLNVKFIPATLNFSLTIGYKDRYYDQSNFASIKNLADVQILTSYPNVIVYNSTETSLRIDNFYYGDKLKMNFGLSNFNPSLISDGGMKDFAYRVTINGITVNPVEANLYVRTITQDLQIVIEIYDIADSVYVQANMSGVGDIVAVTKSNVVKNIFDKTEEFVLSSGDNLIVYIKTKVGYRFVNYSYNYENQITILNTITEGEYAGYQQLTLISNYEAGNAGLYLLNFDYIDISIEFNYYVHDEENNQAGEGYYVDKNTYIITDTAIVFKPEDASSEKDGYRFIGYTIGSFVSEENILIAEGASVININLAEYSEIIDENHYVLPVFVNFINQYRIKVDLDNFDDYGQTNIIVEELGSPSKTIISANNSKYLPLISSYFDETIVSEKLYKITVSSQNDEFYYFELFVNDNKVDETVDGVTANMQTNNGNISGIEYIFMLDKNYEFVVKYYPETYNSNLKEYVFVSNSELTKYLSDGTLPNNDKLKEAEDVVADLGKGENTSQIKPNQISVVIESLSDITNSYLSGNEITITITQELVDGEYITNYNFYKLLIDGNEVGVEISSTTQTIDNKQQVTTTIKAQYTTTKTIEISVLYKTVYKVGVS